MYPQQALRRRKPLPEGGTAPGSQKRDKPRSQFFAASQKEHCDQRSRCPQNYGEKKPFTRGERPLKNNEARQNRPRGQTREATAR
ncbi:hypothetical protein NDU88_005473 [Pleurodeles waltl]|uniref:Uncharacterized protein n=1 Tax=Pleurodeles waltl TaxID=8319 RepID=A0AAV7WYD1_PLEWA|nr:hypothetical protein NDU88_005473 [Pleurodeles waltl]